MSYKRLKEHPYANCRIIYGENGEIALQSYATIVCEIDADGFFLVNGLYSVTTRKQIGWFMAQIGKELNLTDFTYQKAKYIYEKSLVFNIKKQFYMLEKIYKEKIYKNTFDLYK